MSEIGCLHVDFVKKDGSPRTMTCRTGVKKYVKGTRKEATAQRKLTLQDKGLVGVYEMKTENYKTVNLNTVTQLVCGDKILFV